MKKLVVIGAFGLAAMSVLATIGAEGFITVFQENDPDHPELLRTGYFF